MFALCSYTVIDLTGGLVHPYPDAERAPPLPCKHAHGRDFVNGGQDGGGRKRH